MISFDETYMSAGDPLKRSQYPGFGAVNRVPGWKGEERSRVKAHEPTKKVKKGLARSCVSVVRKDARTFEVYVKGSGAFLGTVRSCAGRKGKTYSYKLLTEERSYAGFPSQSKAIDRMLEKC